MYGCISGFVTRITQFAILFALLSVTMGCDEQVPVAPTPQGNQTQIVNINIGTPPSASPSPITGGPCTPGAVDSVRVNPFGYDNFVWSRG